MNLDLTSLAVLAPVGGILGALVAVASGLGSFFAEWAARRRVERTIREVVAAEVAPLCVRLARIEAACPACPAVPAQEKA